MEPIPELFGPWLPDQPALGNPGAHDVFNVLPQVQSGYRPAPKFESASQSLGSRCLGFASAGDPSVSVDAYAATNLGLFELAADGSWTDRTRAVGGAYNAAEFWDEAVWLDAVVMVNRNDYPQRILLGGANFDNLVSDWKSGTVAIVRDFMVHGDINDDIEGSKPTRLRWSGYQDYTDYTPSPSTQSGLQDLKTNAGRIVRIMGGDVGIVFLEKEIWTMSYSGAIVNGVPVIFDIQKVERGSGLVGRKAAVRVNEEIFFCSQDGFRQWSYNRSIPIDEGIVHDRFLAVMEPTRQSEIVAARTSNEHLVVWGVPGKQDPAGRASHIFAYNYISKRWGYAQIEHEFVSSSFTVGDSPDNYVGQSPDDWQGSPDDAVYRGGAESLSIFQPTGVLALPSTTQTYAAFVVGPERQLVPGRRSKTSLVRPVVDGGSGHKASVGYRQDQNQSVTWIGPALPNARSGKSSLRIDARYHRFRVDVEENQPDALILGYEVESVPTGRI